MEKELLNTQSDREEIKQAADALRSLDELDKFYSEKESFITIPTGSEEDLLADLASEWDKIAKDVRIYSGKDEAQQTSAENAEETTDVDAN